MEKIKEDYRSFDIVTEIRTAKAYAEYAQSHVVQARWDDALYAYNKVRQSLISLIAFQGGLSSDELEVCKNHLAIAVDACASIDRLKSLSPSDISADVINANLRDLDGFLITAEITMKGAIRG